MQKAATATLLLALIAGAHLLSREALQSAAAESPSDRAEREENPTPEQLRDRFTDLAKRRADLMSDVELELTIGEMEDWVDSRVGLLRIMEELQALIDAHPQSDAARKASEALRILKGDEATRDKMEQLLETRRRVRQLEKLSAVPKAPPDRPLDTDPGDEDLLNRIAGEWQLPQKSGSGGATIRGTIGPNGSPKVSISAHQTAVKFGEVCNHYAELCGIDRQFNGGQGIGSGKSDRGYYGWMGFTQEEIRQAAFSLRTDRYTASVWLVEQGESVSAHLAVVLHLSPASAGRVGHPTGEVGRRQEYGHVQGQFVLDGDVPNLRPLVAQGANAQGAQVCAAQNVPDESLVVDPETRGIANIFLYMRRAPSSVHPDSADPPKEPVVLDQKNCRFIPHSLFVRTGQKLLVKSSDPIPHNTHTHPILNQEDNLMVRPNDRDGVPLTYIKSEILPTKISCDLHPHMSAYLLILDHPYAAITDEQGRFKIESLPEGEHTFTVWHERVGYLDRSFKVTVQPNQTMVLETVRVPVATLASAERPGR